MLDATLFNDKTQLIGYRAAVWRVVESQEHVATSNIVDDLDEQAVLENLLDEVKPKYRTGTQSMHYLLKTAFRYPPLKWGSRFGTQWMPSYFYASETQAAALHECAYYRFLFLQDIEEPFSGSVRSEFCVFNVLLSSESCLDLLAEGFQPVRTQVIDPTNYAYSQAIGQWAYTREDVEMIRFQSARCVGGVNVAVAQPEVVRSRKPTEQVRWLCLMNNDIVSFSSPESDEHFSFGLDDFSQDNIFLRVNS